MISLLKKAPRSLQKRGLRPGVIWRLKLCDTPSCRRRQSIIRWTKPDQSSKKLVVRCSTSFQARFERPVEKALTSIQRTESFPNQNEVGRCQATVIRGRTIPLKSRWTMIQKRGRPGKYINRWQWQQRRSQCNMTRTMLSARTVKIKRVATTMRTERWLRLSTQSRGNKGTGDMRQQGMRSM